MLRGCSLYWKFKESRKYNVAFASGNFLGIQTEILVDRKVPLESSENPRLNAKALLYLNPTCLLVRHVP